MRLLFKWSIRLCIVLLAFVMFILVWAGLRNQTYVSTESVGTAQTNIVLEGVTVINPESSRAVNQTLRIADGRIVSITSETVNNTRFQGYCVLPGLTNMHVHLWPDDESTNLLLLKQGVTSVRETTSISGSAWQTIDAIERGEVLGPRIFSCGRQIEGNNPVFKWQWQITDPEEIQPMIETKINLGATCVKVYDGVRQDILDQIAVEAKARRIPVIGHIPENVSFAESKVSDVIHYWGVLPYPAKPRAFHHYVYGWKDLLQPQIDEIVSIATKNKIAFTPTLLAWDSIRHYPELAVSKAHWLPYLNFALSQNFQSGKAIPPAEARLVADNLTALKKVIRQMKRAGIEIYPGTDLPHPYMVPGQSLHEELHLFVEAGMTPEEALGSATGRAGKWLSGDGLGKVEEGAPADVLVFKKDPTENLNNLSSLVTVIAQGRYYSIETIDRLLQGRKKANAGLWEKLSSLVNKAFPIVMTSLRSKA